MADKDKALSTVVANVDENHKLSSVNSQPGTGTEGRHGKKGFERYINYAGIMAFGVCYQASWEAVALLLGSGLLNSGPVALVYGCLI